MNIKNKSILFLGDSITQGAMATKIENIFHQVMKRELNLKKAKNYGLGGTRIARQIESSEEPVYDLDFNFRAQMMMKEDADYIFVLGGTNDFGHGDAPIGKSEDTSIYTFYGACKTLFETLIKRYGQDRIIVLTPMHRLNEDNVFGDGSKKKEGAILIDYVNAIREIAKEYGLKIIDLYNIEELNPNIKESAKYFADGLHPNDEGHVLLSHILEREIEKL